jgi:hypothetical protein
MKITSITWGSDVALLAEACAKLGIALNVWTPHDREGEWNADHHGLGSTEIGWSVAMPEFEGVIRAIVWDNRLRRILRGSRQRGTCICRRYSEIHSQARIRLELCLHRISIFTRISQTIRLM